MASSRPIETERLRLEPFTEAHITAWYLGWLNDPKVVRFSERRHRLHTADSAREYLESFRDAPHYFWAIIVADSALRHIGNISAHVDRHNSLADISILVGERAVWGRGFGGEAWCAVMAFLHDELGIRKVTGGTVCTNVGMLHIMQRAGMREDGRRIRHYLVDGEEVDVIHMATFKNARDDRA